MTKETLIDEAIRAAQRELGLKDDGVINPGGPTEKALASVNVAFIAVASELNPTIVEPIKNIPEHGGPQPKYWKSPLMIDGVNVHPIFPVPPPYTHLHPYDFNCKMLGQKEVKGLKDNPITAHTHEHSPNLGAHSDHNDYHDEVANCASGQNYTADGCGCAKAIGALASHFDTYPGRKYKKGELVKKGALVRIAHPNGHITLANRDFIWDDEGSFEGLGWNQGDQVKVSTYPKDTIVTVHDWEPLAGTVLQPITMQAKLGVVTPGESTR